MRAAEVARRQEAERAAKQREQDFWRQQQQQADQQRRAAAARVEEQRSRNASASTSTTTGDQTATKRSSPPSSWSEISTFLFLGTAVWIFFTLLDKTDLGDGASLIASLVGGVFVGATWKFFLKLFLVLAIVVLGLFFLVEVFG